MLTFKEWYYWLKELPLYFKWFPIVVLIRPITDQFYLLKEISPILSPLYWIGILTPIFCYWGIVKDRKLNLKAVDYLFMIFSVISLFSIIGYFFQSGASLYSLRGVLKFALIIYLYPFLRHFIKNKRDLIGIIQTVLYNTLQMFLFFLYTYFFGRKPGIQTRGIERIESNFADVTNFSFAAIIGIIIISYIIIIKVINKRKKKTFKLYGSFILVIIYSLFILFHVNHTASYGVFAAIITLFLLKQFSANKGIAISFASLIIFGYLFFGSYIIKNSIDPLISNEVLVMDGDKNEDQMFHGRMGRWKDMLSNFNNMGPFCYLFGAGYSNKPLTYNIYDKRKYSELLIGIGVHNDFLRIFFLSGLIGAIFFLFFLINLIRISLRLRPPESFLLQSLLAMQILYSLTVLPTMYTPLMYLTLSAYAYACLPIKYIRNT